MTKNLLNKKTIYYLIFIILSVVTFTAVTFIININTPNKWMIKHDLRINEKAVIYLDNIDSLMHELKVKKIQSPSLLSYVDQLLMTQNQTINNILPNVSKAEIASSS